MKSEQLNNLYEFDSLVSRETIDKARRNFKKGLMEVNSKKLIGCKEYYFDRY